MALATPGCHLLPGITETDVSVGVLLNKILLLESF